MQNLFNINWNFDLYNWAYELINNSDQIDPDFFSLKHWELELNADGSKTQVLVITPGHPDTGQIGDRTIEDQWWDLYTEQLTDIGRNFTNLLQNSGFKPRTDNGIFTQSFTGLDYNINYTYCDASIHITFTVFQA